MASEYNTLPECVRKCLGTAAVGAGCSSDDVNCICTKDLADTAGLDLVTCLTGCGSDDLISAPSKLQAICAKITGGAGSSGAATSTSNPSSTKSTASSAAVASETTPVTAGSSSPSAQPTSISSILPSSTGSSGSDGSSSGTSKSGSGSSGLSAGAGAGIGIGAFIGIALLALAGFLLWRRQKKKKRQEMASSPSGSAGELGAVAGELHDKHTHTPELHGVEKQAPAELSPYPNSHAHVPNSPVYELQGTVDVTDGNSTYGTRELDSVTPIRPSDQDVSSRASPHNHQLR